MIMNVTLKMGGLKFQINRVNECVDIKWKIVFQGGY